MNVKEDNIEKVDFYFLMCTKTMYIMQKPYECAWGQQFSASGTIVANKYY